MHDLEPTSGTAPGGRAARGALAADAAMYGVHRSTISRWRTGQTRPRHPAAAAQHPTSTGPSQPVRTRYTDHELCAALHAATGDTTQTLISDRYIRWRMDRLDAGDGPIPSLNTIIHRYGSWNAALQACGWNPGHRDGGATSHWTRDRVVAAVAAFIDNSSAKAVGASQRRYRTWAVGRDVPSLSAVRKHGAWTRLIDEAAARTR